MASAQSWSSFKIVFDVQYIWCSKLIIISPSFSLVNTTASFLLLYKLDVFHAKISLLSLFNLFSQKKERLLDVPFPKTAENGTRTHDPFITSEVLYQLSYSSNPTNINFNRLTTDCQEHFPYVLKEKEDAQQLSAMHLLQYLLFTAMSATVMIFSFVFSTFAFMVMMMVT